MQHWKCIWQNFHDANDIFCWFVGADWLSALGLPPAVWGAPPDHQEESGNRLLPGLQGFRQQGKEYIKHALSIVPLRFRLQSEEKNGKMIVFL